MGNVGKNSKCYTMSKARRLQSDVLEPLLVNKHKDRHGQTHVFANATGSDVMLILLIMQIRSHVKSV